MMTDNPVIRAPIEIAKGEKLSLGVIRDQIPALPLSMT